MKYMISYFYKIRFFSPNMIPFSTAVWNPKWYHNNKDQNYNFIDKRGVINGLRFKEFMPGTECSNLCRGPEKCKELSGENPNPKTCLFLSKYKEQISKINFEEMDKYFEEVSKRIKEHVGFEKEPIIVFIVHEADRNPCSERQSIFQVFEEKGYKIEEFDEKLYNFPVI